ncbi:MAG: hypothetical protein HQM08_20130 [Candidatus Riflebacteria bacterium]|nr:hypothetical protein [Candidatus Riflebacteria bacterium]
MNHRKEEAFSKVIEHGKELVLGFARSWKAQGMTMLEKTREIWCEIFLILIEEIDLSRINHVGGLASYLSLRLRRLTRPKESKAVPFGLSEDLPDTGRLHVTPLRLDTVKKLVNCVRCNLAGNAQGRTGLLEFAFLHVSPELRKVSNFLATLSGDDPLKLLESDKKRHQAFNHSLRRIFNDQVGEDWREVSDWSFGERSHLAWSIIEFSIPEKFEFGSEMASFFDQWRDSADPFQKSNSVYLENIQKALHSLERLYPKRTFLAMEEAVEYGSGIQSDIIESLICIEAKKEKIVREPENSYSSSNLPLSDNDSEFYEIATEEVKKWLLNLLKERDKSDESASR